MEKAGAIESAVMQLATVNQNCQSPPAEMNMYKSCLDKPSTSSPLVPAPLLACPTSSWRCSFCSFLNKCALPWVRPQIFLCILPKAQGPRGWRAGSFLILPKSANTSERKTLPVPLGPFL